MKPHFLIFNAALFLLASCASYKKNIMFRTEGSGATAQLERAAESNYIIRKNDVLRFHLYTNAGEKIIDPNSSSLTNEPEATDSRQLEYVVDLNGFVKLPLVGEVKLEGLSVPQAEQVLGEAYTKYYQDPFVVIDLASKRAFVLGAPGGQVIPLTYPNMKLTEVLALAKGIGDEANAGNIRVLRGDQTFVIDFSTVRNFVVNDMIIQPGDVIYVEPVRRPFAEGLRDVGPLLSIVTSIGTLIVVILQLQTP